MNAPQAGKWYNISIRAFNEADEFAGKGAAVAARGVCVDGGARPSVCGLLGLVAVTLPTSPESFELSANGSLVVRGAWGRPADTGDGSGGYPLVGYEYLLGEGAGFVDAAETVVGDAVGEVESRGLRAGGVYVGKVRARNDAGYSNWTGALNPQSLNSQSLNPQSLNPQSLNPQSLHPQSLIPQSLNPHSLNPQHTPSIQNSESSTTK